MILAASTTQPRLTHRRNVAGQVAHPSDGRRRAPKHDDGRGSSLELPADCVELFAQALHVGGAKSEDGKLPLPKWVHLSPAGDEGHELALKGERVVRGRDGREFAVGDVKRVLKGTELPMQFDWDHESVSWFGSTKAAGWLDKVEYLEEGDDERPAPGFWGRVERWTPEGKASVEDGYYRGISPVVRYEYRQPSASDEPAPPPLLVGFVNVALTNRPNLKMTLLNHEEPRPPRNEARKESEMDEDLEELATELGLATKVSHKELVRAVRERHSATQGRVMELERQIAAEASAAFRRDVESAFAEATASGKIAPAVIESTWRRIVTSREQLEVFREHVKTLSQHAVARPEPTPEPGPTDAMSAEERKVMENLGFTEAQWREGGSR